MQKVRSCLVVMVFCLLMMAVGWLLLPRPPLLLSRAHSVGSTEGWHEGKHFVPNIGVHWLSDHELLYGRIKVESESKGEGEQTKEQQLLYRRDIQTYRDTILPFLMKSLTTASATEIVEVADDTKVSPDGRWFVLSVRWGSCLISEIAGPHRQVYRSQRTDCYRRIYWLPDSRHWIEAYVRNRKLFGLFLHDVQDLRLSQEIPLDKNGNRDRTEEKITNEVPERLVSQDRGLYLEWPQEDVDDFGSANPNPHSGSTKQVTLSVRSLTKRGAPSIIHTLTLPIEVAHGDLVISPDGTHVAWLVDTTYADPMLVGLHKYLPIVKPVTQFTSSLWVSDLDGKNRREVGRIQSVLPTEEINQIDTGFFEPPSAVGQLQWLPSGKSLSFEHQRFLYTVPAF